MNKLNASSGSFVISLDFELLWGVRDVLSIRQYGDNILGVRNTIPALLRLFRSQGIRATWATVGFLTFANRKELLTFLPEIKPEYTDQNLDPYAYLSSIGNSERDDPYHYGYSLVSQIQDTPGMEIASHSFSHFYCLEPRANALAHLADLKASNAAFNRIGISPRSIVFARNQYDAISLSEAFNCGFRNFRGNEASYIYQPSSVRKISQLHRVTRLVDTYLNLTGPNTHDISEDPSGLANIPSSRFLRPAKISFLEDIRLKRIQNAMTHAAETNTCFHLWWHPHNFGVDLDLNLIFLSRILMHFHSLRDKYGMQSMTMSEAAKTV